MRAILVSWLVLVGGLTACSSDSSAPATPSPAGGSGGAAGAGGGAAGSGGASSGSGGAAGGVVTLGCDQPAGQPGGFEVCSSGRLHRTTAVACEDQRDGQDISCGSTGIGGNEPQVCKDADCEVNGAARCQQSCGGAGCQFSCLCEGDCLSDADCGGQGVCQCAGKTGQCVEAQCKGDADCAGGGLCLEVFTANTKACGSDARRLFACTTPQDECDDDKDCGGPGRFCVLEGSARVCRKAPIPCCDAQGCPGRCWDAQDCGGQACLFAPSAYCQGISDGNPATVQRDGHCASPKDTCTRDSDCTELGKSYCVYDGDHLRCGSLPFCQPP